MRYKSALEGFSRCVREELRDRKVRVISVYPAATDTEIWSQVEGKWPRDRMMSATQVADAVAFALARPTDTLSKTSRSPVWLEICDSVFAVMINALQSELGINVIASIIVSALFLVIGFVWGKYKERQRKFGRNLEEYDFYPFIVSRENFGGVQPERFPAGDALLPQERRSYSGATNHFIGEQNNVRTQLEPAEQKVYAQLFEKYDGKRVTDDTHEFLENYERIVRLIGKSFPSTGIEILLHNLADPAYSPITLENNVTGRHYAMVQQIC